VQLHVVADLEATDHVEQGLQRQALGIQRHLVAEVQDAQVAEHLALRREKRRVAACSRGERLGVVRHLPGKELLRARAGQRELAALGAVEESAALGERAVLGVEAGRVGRGH
jgi:hypothetical protein